MVNPNTPGYFARFLHQMLSRGVLSGAPQYAFSVDRNAGLGKYPGWKCHLTLSATDGTKIACSASSNSKKNAKQGAAHEGFVMLIHHLHEAGRLSFAPASTLADRAPIGDATVEKAESVVTTSPDPERESAVAEAVDDAGDEIVEADAEAMEDGEKPGTITVPTAISKAEGKAAAEKEEVKEEVKEATEETNVKERTEERMEAAAAGEEGDERTAGVPTAVVTAVAEEAAASVVAIAVE